LNQINPNEPKMPNKRWDLIIIGGGAAGMAAAVAAAEAGDRVLLLEAQEKIGKKVLASGNGRCNLMNTGALKYYGNPEFAGQVLNRLPREELERFFRAHGLALASEGESVYPGTFQAQSVLTAFKAFLEMLAVDVRCSARVEAIEKTAGGFRVRKKEGWDEGARLLIATGGAAQPKLGGNECGYAFLRRFGHTIHAPFPALAPIMTDRKGISGLAGIRARGTISLVHPDGERRTESGEILFTEYGVSGICAMQLGRFARPGDRLEIHFLSRWFRDADEARADIEGRRQVFRRMAPEYLLNGYVMPKVSFAICKQAGLAMRGETIGELTEEQIRAVCETACRYTLQVQETRGLSEAQVTAGGADPEEFDPGTMASKKCPGLYAAGEVLDVDGDCGGFNLMFAFAGGILAGRNGRKTTQKGDDGP